MFRLGIIGTENSHAMAFSRIINLPDPETGKLRFPDARVVGVYGPDAESARKIVAEAGAEFVAESPDGLLGKVDALFVTSRRGSVHRQYALPFIEKGMPVFVDKPFTQSLDDAEALVAAARKSGAKLYGGSGTKLSYDVLMLRNTVKKARASGGLQSGWINYRADPASEYDGFCFYAPHLVEIALTVFGYGLKSVLAVDRDGNRKAIARFEDVDVVLDFAKDAPDFNGMVLTKTGGVFRPLDISLIYPLEVEHFIGMLRGGEMPLSFEQLVMPVRVISAIERSCQSGVFEAV